MRVNQNQFTIKNRETQQKQDLKIEPQLNENNVYSKDILPKYETNAIDHDICFMSLNKLLMITKIMQQQKKQIENEDIKEFITKSTQIQFTIEQLEQYKKNNPLKFQKSNKFKLMPVYFHMTYKYLLIGLFFSIIQFFLECSCVYMLDLITDKLKLYQGQYSEKRDLFLCLIGISLFYLLKNICYTRFYWYEAKWQSKAYATLQYLVFTKYLKSQEISSDFNNNQDIQKEQEIEETPDINNIMTSDIDQQMYLYRTFIQSIVGIVSVITALIFIYIKIGKYMLNGLYVLIAAFIINFIAVQILHVFYGKQFKTKDQRISLCNDVIDGIKSIKFLGWENIFKKKIQNIRSKEFSYVLYTKIFDQVQVTIFTILSYLMLFLFLTNYVNDGGSLSDSNIFTIIALYDIMNMPLTYLPWNVASFQKLIVSYKRINTFLNQKEINTENVINEEFHHLDKNNDKDFLIQSNQTPKIAVQIKDMKFVWPEQECGANSNKPCIRKFELNISELKANKGELVVIIGKIGSGKSALLKAILNELSGTNLQSGQGSQNKNNKIVLNGKRAFVPQNHWLQNKTIKENILFGSEYEPERYEECIEACDLKTDFNCFNQKDEKLVGPGGANLSGGQRQRVAICRALYQNRDIYLLDDIFSSLDVHVAHKVFQSVVMNVLVKKYKKTVFLVTSHFSILSQRQNINQILYLENGSLIKDSLDIEKFIQNGLNREQEEQKVIQSNISNEIQLKKGASQETQKQELEDISININQISILKNEVKENETSYQQEQISQQDNQSGILILKNEPENTLNEQVSEEIKEQSVQNENQEERETGNVKLKTFRVYFKSIGTILLIILLILNYLMSGTQMLIDFWLRDCISPSIPFYQSINEIFNSFFNTFLFFIMLNILVNVFRALIYSVSSLKGSKRLFKQLNKSIIYSKMSFFDKNPVGRIINRLSDDVTVIDEQLPWSFDYLIGLIAATANYTFAILVQFPWLAIFVVSSIVLFYLVQKIFRTLTVEIKRLHSVNSGKLLSTLGETSKGLILIRSFNKQKYIMKEFLERLNENINSNVINQALQIWMSIRLLFISNLIFISVAITHIMLLFSNYEIEYTTVAMCITYSMLFSQRFTEVVRFFSYVEINIVSVERIRQYFNNKQEDLEEIQNREDIQMNQLLEIKIQEIKHIQEDSQEITKKVLKDDNVVIEFEDVWLSYDHDLNENYDSQNLNKDISFALKGISIQIKKGEKIAFCGRTGSGKTSILNVLFRMYPIQHGSIFFKGKKIQSYSLKSLRSQMSVIPQFGFIYNATLKDNIDPEDKICTEEIQEKLQNTNLNIQKHEIKKTQKQERQSQEEFQEEEMKFISSSQQDELPKQNQINIDFEIKEGGSNLSNGEKQIVNFFRIIMRETEIICLDEATSNMDPKTDQEIHKQIFQFASDKTLIVITHRLENIDQFDRVAVLDEGRIVECGRVTDLRQIQGGFFNKLINDKQKSQNKC
ncbi:ABC transporter C family protein (macronuclear) [Tetrahymena thermophila SB210]|uniref:ABC transporter C family protein n=1 Tax=Tetrahymena thermophila (strain SB210) TaxID=312017 RepID=Q22TT4_TETTS|nr:ABC transporter C family protein [Tetrahymena thermophila SB210]EAR88677.2 ABC transporter C family protein [Tetrahymena thermophila SB210]|eukprot:XP_001008922.2 ABC transporter C family protein [Tetrahymena thermophila SB210]